MRIMRLLMVQQVRLGTGSWFPDWSDIPAAGIFLLSRQIQGKVKRDTSGTVDS